MSHNESSIQAWNALGSTWYCRRTIFAPTIEVQPSLYRCHHRHALVHELGYAAVRLLAVQVVLPVRLLAVQVVLPMHVVLPVQVVLPVRLLAMLLAAQVVLPVRLRAVGLVRTPQP